MKKMIITAAQGLNSRERAEMARHEQDAKKLARFYYDDSIAVKRALARNPFTPEDILRKLSSSNDNKVLKNLIYNSNTPEDVVEEISANFYIDGDEALRDAIASHTSNTDILRYLSNDSSSEVRNGVVHNKGVSEDLLTKLSDDLNRDTLAAIAINMRTPPEVLDKLSRNVDTWIRSNVAANENSPESIQLQLAEDPSDHVLRSLCYNEGLSRKAIIKLLKLGTAPLSILSRNPAYIEIKYDPDILDLVLRGGSNGLKRDLASSEDTPQNILDVLNNDNVEVRLGLLYNESIPLDDRVEILKDIAQNADVSWMYLDDWILRSAKLDNSTIDDLMSSFIGTPYIDKITSSDISKCISQQTWEDVVNYEIAHGKLNDVADYMWEILAWNLIDDKKLEDKIIDRILSSKDTQLKKWMLKSYYKWPERLKAGLETNKRKKQEPSSDWSISPYEVDNYSVLSNEIDQLVEQAVKGLVNTYFEGSYGTYEKDGNYDDGGTLKVIVDGKDVVELDLEDVAALVTSQQKKQKGVKALLNKMASQVM